MCNSQLTIKACRECKSTVIVLPDTLAFCSECGSIMFEPAKCTEVPLDTVLDSVIQYLVSSDNDWEDINEIFNRLHRRAWISWKFGIGPFWNLERRDLDN